MVGFTLDDGGEGTAPVCLGAEVVSAGIIFMANGGYWPNEIQWALLNSTGHALNAGGPGVVTTCSSECADRFVHLQDSYGDVSHITSCSCYASFHVL